MHMLSLSTHTKTEVKKRREKVELVEGKKIASSQVLIKKTKLT